jgi:hypothetical protein
MELKSLISYFLLARSTIIKEGFLLLLTEVGARARGSQRKEGRKLNVNFVHKGKKLNHIEPGDFSLTEG